MKKLLSGLLLAAAVIVGLPAATYAHTTATDETGKGGVMHISPTDDPAVGEKATIFLDIQGFDDGVNKATLDISLAGAQVETLELAIGDNQLSTDYTFTKPGTYTLDFAVESHDETTNFDYEQIVAGAATAATTANSDTDTAETAATNGSVLSQPWALGLLAVVGVGIGVLLSLFVNKRKKIAEKSAPKH